MTLWLIACSEYAVSTASPVDVAEPPGSADDDWGDAPDWNDCTGGWAGAYYNHQPDHPDMEPDDDAPPPEDFEGLDWWSDDYVAFERFDPSVDHGQNWWPVDEGYADDPSYFAARWNGWLRVYEDTTVPFIWASSDDAWMVLNGDVVAALPGVKEFDSEEFVLELEGGQYQVELRYAHRADESGFSWRAASDDVKVCHPEYE